MDTGGQQVRGVGVTKIVQSHTLQAVSFKEIREGVREACSGPPSVCATT